MRQIEEGPDYHASTIAMVSAAYPGDIDDTEYLPLLAVLHDHMSFRSIASFMALFEGYELSRRTQ